MKPLPLQIKPGVVRRGTIYESRGRWYATDLVRWIDGALQPWGGWSKLQDGVPADVTIGEVARGMFAWESNYGVAHLLVGGPTTLKHFSGTTQTDITPSDLKTGSASSTTGTGVYGLGPYGRGLYGTGDNTQVITFPAAHWHFDNYGEDALMVMIPDRRILRWQPSVGGAPAVLPGSPGDCVSVVVTPERFVVALGPDGDPRRIEWADQDDPTDWTPTTSNSAGGLNIADQGAILNGKRTRSETLVWTTQGLHALRYIGGDLIYAIKRIADGVGAIDSRSMALLGEVAYWMGDRTFFRYDGGAVVPLPDDVNDYVFDDIDRTQTAKIVCFTRKDFGEVVWHYPSESGAGENDRYVSYNAWTNEWALGELERTAGVDAEPFAQPMAADSNGQVYEHETGSSYLDTDGATPLTPYGETGPVEITQGEHVLHVLGIIPDEAGSGTVQYRLYTSNSPTDLEASEVSNGPFTTSEKIDTRLTARMFRYRVEHVSGVWEHGTPRLLVRPGGRRW